MQVAHISSLRELATQWLEALQPGADATVVAALIWE